MRAFLIGVILALILLYTNLLYQGSWECRTQVLPDSVKMEGWP